jgi:DNA-binding response OmpR family regulator
VTPSSPGPPAPAPAAPGRVLVVDDDEQVRGFVAHILNSEGHTTDQAGSTEAALELARDREYDVVLVDLLLPGRSGLDLIAGLPADPGPVPVLLTGTRDVRAAVAAMQRGAFDYLPKPVSPDLLGWVVGRAVGEARGRRRARETELATAVWEATFDACPDVLLVLDAGRQILKANRAAARMAGGRPAALAGRPVRDVFPAALGEVAAGDPDGVNRPAGFDGQEYLVSVNPLLGGAGGPAPVVVVARNVTALVRGEQDRYRLAQRVVSAQEDERGRVSRELHDGVGQAVVSLALGLAALDDLVPPGAARDLVRELGRAAGDAADDIRRISHYLRPPVLDDHGLPAALAQLTTGFRRAQGVRAELILTAPPPGGSRRRSNWPSTGSSRRGWRTSPSTPRPGPPTSCST